MCFRVNKLNSNYDLCSFFHRTMDGKLLIPFTMLMAGASQSGKSTLVYKIIENANKIFDKAPNRIFICYGQMQPLYKRIVETSQCPVTLIEGLPADLVTPSNSLLIIDDLQGINGELVSEWFTKKCHHLKTSVIYLVQNLFLKPPSHRTISLNSHYMVIFKSPRDSSQIIHLAKQIFPGESQTLISAYREATAEPYSYIFLDLKQQTEDIYRLRSSVFPWNCFVFISPKTPTYKWEDWREELSHGFEVDETTT